MNAYEYLANQRVNIELMLYRNDKNILHYGVRLRPWRQDTRVPSMVLVQGLSMDNAMDNAARALFKGEWVKLDYAARPWLNVLPESTEPVREEDYSFLRPGSDLHVPISDTEHQGGTKAKVARQNGSQ